MYCCGIINVSPLALSSWLECGSNGLYSRDIKLILPLLSNLSKTMSSYELFLQVSESTKQTGCCLTELLSSAHGNHNGFPY